MYLYFSIYVFSYHYHFSISTYIVQGVVLEIPFAILVFFFIYDKINKNMDLQFGGNSKMNQQYKIYTTAPTDERISKEAAVYKLLDDLDIPYERVDHPAAMTIEDCQDVDKILKISLCKNLFLCNRQKTDFYLLLMPGNKAFKTKDLSKQIGSARLSFGDAEYMEKYLNITPGSVSVMGLMNDTDNHVRLLIDEDVINEAYIAFHPCINTSSLKASTKDILEKYLPAVNHEYTLVTL